MGTEGLEDGCSEYEERDPTGRYIRYNEVLGRGAFKTVYKAFDEIDGIEVAWNQIEIEEVVQSREQLDRLHSEVRLLKSLKHENIIKLYYSWVDEKRKTINMITELFTSGSLRQYRRKHKNVDIKAIKNWARQILRGLQYLHSNVPPIIHRDVKCDNIFVNGNNGEVKIGDLGLATVMQMPTAHSVIGTPEFMAPELYDEEYNELADIYSFGMSMLEMVTSEYPYCECKNPAQIFKKVTSGIKPASLEKVKDPEVRQFIEKCLRPSSSRLSASELLNEPCLIPENLKEPVKSLNLPVTMPKATTQSKSEALPMDIDATINKSSTSSSEGSMNDHSSTIELQKISDEQKFSLQGKRKEDAKIKMALSISGRGSVKKFSFKFFLHSDTALSVANEMVEELGLSIKDVAVVAGLIDELLAILQSDSKYEATSSGAKSSSTISFDGLHLWDSELADYPESGTKNAQELPISDGMLSSIGVQGSFTGSQCGTSEDMSLSSIDSQSLMYKDQDEDVELKQELEAIDVHFNECYSDLRRRKQEAIESAKLKWLERKKTSFVNGFPFSSETVPS
uniref:non-specific serine/threonine protein kinase n=1 Tax=Kalanchoe fedtschenkoi TaxID=63787 RepID=A0A7N0TQK3_KALFE